MQVRRDTFRLAEHELSLDVSDRTFVPTLTSELLAETMDIPAGSRVLDLGCGVGPIAIYAAKAGAGEVVAVDIMEEACELTRRNARLNGVADRIQVIHSDLFSEIFDQTFDVIVDDVSGMSEKVSRISPWYPNTIPTGGEDGTGPTCRMLEEAPEHMNEDGVLYFPVISLSAIDRIMATARKVYGQSLKQLARKRIPFCDEFRNRVPEMEDLQRRGLIQFEQVRSRLFWTLEVYAAKRA